MNKNIVLIGGGHGLSNLVRDFKDDESINLSIIVSSTDDGGHTGKLREEFDLVAVGDLRMVLNELIKEENLLKDFFNYRFESLHGMENVSLGNLVLTSLVKKYGDVDKAIYLFCEKEKIDCDIYLSSNNPLTLCAETSDGRIIKNEKVIGTSNKEIEKLYTDKKAVCNPKMLESIETADVIVFISGSLYTSVGAVLCVDRIKEALKNSNASIVYVCNIMTQDGETRGYTVKNHVEALEKIMERKIDRVIVNNGKIENEVLDRYRYENSEIVQCDIKEKNYEFYDLVEIIDNKIRHNSKLVKKIIFNQQ